MDGAFGEFDALIDAQLAADRSARARVKRVIGWILEDRGAAQERGRLAERAAMSARTLSRVFRRETGMSPARFVEQARLRFARSLIEHSGHRLERIAACAGFRSAERMRRAFHRRLAATPAQVPGEITRAQPASGTTRTH